MNKANLKRYAPQARKDFIAAVTQRAQLLGLSLGATGRIEVERCTVQGDVAVIAGRAWPASVSAQRDALYERMVFDGYAQTLEAIAYTWFNRLAALRYMELHDYLGHGRRVLSNPDARSGGLPEVLTHALALAEAGDLPGLNAAQVRDLKLANQDGELYRRVLIAQCNALHQAMPFLFEALDDETELLLPDKLLLSDAIVAKLVAEIPEEDWAEVEVIGWLYQFYISEKKDQVIGKVVKSEDIPAATQLFTPNWIVQYLVQNSVGRLWLMANPGSTLASQWPYYIQPAEQTPEVQAQLDALIQTRIREDVESGGEALNPETITVLDPACGSGHILVVAYDVLKAIYLERGYQPRAIPRLILEKNLYGLDIDDRAAQLAAFALLMKARADDRRLFTDPPKLNVLSLQESKGLDVEELVTHLAPFGLQRAALKTLLDTFEHAKTFGSLIQIPAALNGQLAAMTAGLQRALQDGDLYARQAAKDVLPLVWQALVLGMQFDAVVANPPYMGLGAMNPQVKALAKDSFPDAKNDLCACFIEKGYALAKYGGHNAMVTMQSWMFLSSFEKMRERILQQQTIESMAHLSNGILSGFGTTAAVLRNHFVPGFVGSYSYTSKCDLNEQQIPLDFPVRNDRLKTITQIEYEKIPGSPLAYFASSGVISAFANCQALEEYGLVRQGAATSDNERFLRLWPEVAISDVGFGMRDLAEASESAMKWFPYNKGGGFRKWYGNHDHLVNYQYDGKELKEFQSTLNQGWTVRLKSREYYFKESVSWPKISSSETFSARFYPNGFIFDVAGCCYFPRSKNSHRAVVAFLNSNSVRCFLEVISPTVNFEIEHVKKVPFINLPDRTFGFLGNIYSLAQQDWDAYERSWDFQLPPILTASSDPNRTLQSSYTAWTAKSKNTIAEMKRLEEENNRIFIDAYGLGEELTPDVSIEQITLTVNPAHRYGGKLTEDELWTRFRRDTCEELVSYAIGCMMGRYSLDEPGLIYAHAGNVGFDPSRYEKKFPADTDGIVPITDEHWFEDDAASRVREFLRAVWGAETLEENMAWLAESLGMKSTKGGSETPDETIRRYLADKFFKDHLQTYKKRPIYWLFSSGKQGAFQALVYLHRYHEGTLARLRAEYVLPLTGKMQARIESLQADLRAAASTAARTKLNKQLEALKKQQLELLAYDERLRQYADMRISLDLDDGVKVNYGKFGDLLAEVKAVTGGGSDE